MCIKNSIQFSMKSKMKTKENIERYHQLMNKRLQHEAIIDKLIGRQQVKKETSDEIAQS